MRGIETGRRSRRHGAVAMVVGMLGLAGCAGGAGPSLDAGLAAKPEGEAAGKPAQPRAVSLAELARAHAEKPTDAKMAIRYARALKAAGKGHEALGILDAVREANPENRTLLAEQGLLALELGRSKQAHGLLTRAAAGEGAKDWRVLSGLGVASASLGQHAEAQKHLARSLELSPDNPAILNNMALSYMLEAKVQKAEPLLRKASASGDNRRIARNLELAMSLKKEPAKEAGEAGIEQE